MPTTRLKAITANILTAYAVPVEVAEFADADLVDALRIWIGAHPTRRARWIRTLISS